jgi:hypothetical protein
MGRFQQANAGRNNVKCLFITAALLTLCLASAASAESFTTEYTVGPKTVIVSPNPRGGSPLLAGHWSGNAVNTFKSGAVTKSTSDCVAWTTPTALTNSAVLCSVSDNATDTYTMSMVCQDPADVKDPSAARYCWGSLTGTGGKYAGKAGVYSIIGYPRSGSGQGAWKD